MVGQLQEFRTVTCDAAGEGQVVFACPPRQRWVVTTCALSVSAGTRPRARVYRGSASPANLQGTSNNATSTTGVDVGLELKPGQILTVAFDQADAGAIANATLGGQLHGV